MSIALNLEHYHFKKVYGEITMIGTWLIDGESNRPCMVLLRTGEELIGTTVPSLIPLDTAYQWADLDLAKSLPIVEHKSREIAKHLRLAEHDPKTIRRIGSLILENLGELLNIPPYSPLVKDKSPIGVVTITNLSTGEKTEREILADDI